MALFKTRQIQRIAHELTFGPASQRRARLKRAENLFWELEDAREYDPEFIAYKITGVRSEPASPPPPPLTGRLIKADLGPLVEQLSESLEESPDDLAPAFTEDQLRRRLAITAKTLSRYRRQGLFARKATLPGAKRKKLLFTQACLERFLAANGPRVKKATQFSRLDEPTRHAILLRARRLAFRAGASRFIIARHLARKFGRTAEAIRLLLEKHDQRNPRMAIFPDHIAPLTEKQHRVILRAWRAGVGVGKMARRFEKSRQAIYRVIQFQRARAIGRTPILYVPNPTFEHPDAEEVLLGSTPPGLEALLTHAPTGKPAPRTARAPTRTRGKQPPKPYEQDLLPHSALSEEAERSLFVRYNYLKYRAALLRKELQTQPPTSLRLDRIETFLRRAAATRRWIIQANLRLLIATARKQIALHGDQNPQTLPRLMRQGWEVLLESIDAFDAAGKSRFARFLTFNLMKRFARQSDEPLTADPRPAISSFLDPAEERRRMVSGMADLLAGLSQRQRTLLSRHFGLVDDQTPTAEPFPLEQIARSLNLPVEQARRIERRALAELRRRARAAGLSWLLEEFDMLGTPAADNAPQPHMPEPTAQDLSHTPHQPAKPPPRRAGRNPAPGG